MAKKGGSVNLLFYSGILFFLSQFPSKIGEEELHLQ